MEESYQKPFVNQSFVERVSFSSIPKYGWKVHPITLDLDHQEFGRIGIKTEIHSPGDPTPPVIYNTP